MGVIRTAVGVNVGAGSAASEVDSVPGISVGSVCVATATICVELGVCNTVLREPAGGLEDASIVTIVVAVAACSWLTSMDSAVAVDFGVAFWPAGETLCAGVMVGALPSSITVAVVPHARGAAAHSTTAAIHISAAKLQPSRLMPDT